MNYIQSLQSQNKEKQDKLNSIQEEINSFILFLHSDKFKGVESDGGRKDWISTADVLNKLLEIRMLTL